MKKSMWVLFLCINFFLVLSLFFHGVDVEAEDIKSVYVLSYSGIVSPIFSRVVSNALDIAERDNAHLLVIELDTPGGLDTSMREVVKGILNARIPIVVYIYPKGARAASAGVFITLSAHIAAMAPGTNIGAAHPVSLMGKSDKTMEKKIENDAVAYIRALAKQRGRNEDWAEKAVRESVSIDAEEAVKLHVVDYIAKDLDELLDKIDGKEVEVSGKMMVIDTKSVTIKYIKMNFIDILLKYITNPNVAYILLFIGFYGIIGEFSHPGSILPGVVGVISLILAFTAFQALPINYGGIALIIFGIFLFIVELFTPTFGAFTLGGVVSLIVGSLMLSKTNVPFLKVSLQVILPMVFTTFVFFVFAIGKAIRIQFKRPVTGKEGLIGEIGIARTRLDPSGMVLVHGELWRAESLSGIIEEGEEVRVKEVLGLKIKVERIKKGV